MRPVRSALVPVYHGTRSAQRDPNDTEHDRMPHRAIGCEPRRDVAAQDAVDDAIRCRKHP